MATQKTYANDPFGTYANTQERRWQVIYLYQEYTASVVSNATGYAKSTVRSYAAKYKDELPMAIAFFETVTTTINRRKTIHHSENCIQWGNTKIEWLNNTTEKDNEDGEKVYLFRFYEDKDADPVFSKIGTTTKSCLARLKDEIRYYEKRGFNINYVEICEIWDCQSMPAESYESFMRALLIKKFPNTWKKNDRFFGVSIPTELFIKFCSMYAET